jgi:hypothetical protein
VVVVAFYSGNDALESFRLAYSAEPWSRLRLDPNITASDGPPVKYPPPKSWWWEVNFKDRVTTTFIPRFRLASNMDHPAVKAGYAIMAETARLMSDMAGKAGVPIVFTIIPSKELVYAEKVRGDGIDAPDDYLSLIKAEEANLRGLALQLAKLPHADYVDLLSPLQGEALKPLKLYPPDGNGHPLAAGYDFIARTLAPAVNRHLPQKKSGLFRIRNREKRYLFILVKDDGVWYFGSREIIKANGWTLDETPLIESRDIAGLPIRGIIGMADPMQFGPKSVK